MSVSASESFFGIRRNNVYLVRFEGIAAASMKTTVFWDIGPTAIIIREMNDRPDDGGSSNL
jgi:hypothetical protein